MDKLASAVLCDSDFTDSILAYEAENERFYDASKNCRSYEPKVTNEETIKHLKHNFETVFRDMAETNLKDIVNIIDNLLDYLPSEKVDTGAIHYLKDRITNIAKSSKVTPEDLYRVRISNFCEWSGGSVTFPNGWKASMRGRDNLSGNGYEEDKFCCLRFYLTTTSMSMTDKFPRDYFHTPDGKFWKISKLEWVDFDDCSFNELEPVFDWLNANDPKCLE